MKLLNKTTISLFLSLIPVFIISGFILFLIINQQINENEDESLLARKSIIVENLRTSGDAKASYLKDADNDVDIRLSDISLPFGNTFKDTTVYDSSEMEFAPFRQLNSVFKINSNTYELSITHSNIKTDELAESISIALAIMFALILIVVVSINRFVSRKLFSPFYFTLDKLRNLSFSDTEPFQIQNTTTKEFQDLNIVLNSMTSKLFTDYKSQKQFTENASHELQTPLAIIKTRMDVLMQDVHLSEESIEQIQEIEKAVNKLSHLNKSLLLLTKIENGQFNEYSYIELAALTDKTILAFEDSIRNKSISLTKDYSSSVELNMNPILADILISNLLQNSIRHNWENGVVKIKITENCFSISNSGNPLLGKEEMLFNRFTKFNPAVESIGLGLSIVKQICDYYKFKIIYGHNGTLHKFEIFFD